MTARKWVRMYHLELNTFIYVCRISEIEYMDKEGRKYSIDDFYAWKVTE